MRIRQIVIHDVTHDLAFHAPCCLIRHANFSLNFSRAKRFRPCTDQEHQKVPNLQTHASTRKSCIGHRMDVMPAPLTDEGGLLRQAMKARAPRAFRATSKLSESYCQQMLQTDIVGWKSTRELPENFARHGSSNRHGCCG